MIENEHQHQVARATLAKFEHALAHADGETADLDPRLRQAFREALEFDVAQLRAELAEYQNRQTTAGAARADRASFP